MNETRTARCVSCRSEVHVPDSYSDGSQIGCTGCGVQLRIIRGAALRVVVADLLALNDALRENKKTIAETTRDLQAARASWGIGVNGLGLGVLYVVARVALEEREFERGLIIEAVILSVVVGALLELANTLFLAKRKTISNLTDQLRFAVAEQREIQRKIRESTVRR